MPKITSKVSPTQTKIAKPSNCFMLWKAFFGEETRRLGAIGVGVPEILVEEARRKIQAKAEKKRKSAVEGKGKKEAHPKNLPLYHAPQEEWAEANLADVNTLMGLWWEHQKVFNPDTVQQWATKAAQAKKDHAKKYPNHKETRKPRTKKAYGPLPQGMESSKEYSSFAASDTVSLAVSQALSLVPELHNSMSNSAGTAKISQSPANPIDFPLAEIPHIVPCSTSRFAAGSPMGQHVPLCYPPPPYDRSSGIARTGHGSQTVYNGGSMGGSWISSNISRRQVPGGYDVGNTTYSANDGFAGHAPQTNGLTFSQPQVVNDYYGGQIMGDSWDQSGTPMMPTDHTFQPWALPQETQTWLSAGPSTNFPNVSMVPRDGSDLTMMAGPSPAPRMGSDRYDSGDWDDQRFLEFLQHHTNTDIALQSHFAFANDQIESPPTLAVSETFKMSPSGAIEVNPRWEGDHHAAVQMVQEAQHGGLELCYTFNF